MGNTILVIDDERQIVEIVGDFLTLQGFEVHRAYDGQGGLDILKRGIPIDLVILDDKMPGMGGTFFLKEMKQLGMNIPVVVLTGSINLSPSNRANRKPYKHLLIKPIRLSELLKMVNKILASRKRHTADKKRRKDR